MLHLLAKIPCPIHRKKCFHILPRVLVFTKEIFVFPKPDMPTEKNTYIELRTIGKGS